MSVARPWTSFRLRRRLRAARAGSAPRLPEFARKADDLEALKKAVDDAASVSGGLWFSYLFLLTYLAIAAGAVTHADLFFEEPIGLLLVNVTVPIVAFFALAPLLFLALHAYTLASLVMLTEKTKRFHRALYSQIGETPGMSAEERRARKDARDGLRGQLPSNVFVQFLAGPPELRAGLFGWGLRAIGWITLAIGPALLLLLFQVQFLPYHSAPITLTHRVALFVDFLLVWWLWRRILSARWPDDERSVLHRVWTLAGFVAFVAVVLFSFALATYRGEEGIVIQLASRVVGEKLASVHDAIFHSQVSEQTRRREWLLSDTLVLPRLDALAELKIDDPERTKWKDYIFIAADRDLVGADFEKAIIPRIDFSGAILTGADFRSARMDHASLFIARLEGALLDYTQLEGASLVGAQLRGASLFSAQLEGVLLDHAQLQGALLDNAHVAAASLIFARLQGASLASAQLQAASLDRAQLQGASLDGAQLQGASLVDAQLQGASLDSANLGAADLRDAGLWRSSGDDSQTGNLDIEDTADVWGPFLLSPDGTRGPWDKAAYEALRNEIGALPAGQLREEALARVRTLDCADMTRVSCDPVQARTPPPEFAVWRDRLIAAKVGKPAFQRSLANGLRELVCKSVTSDFDVRATFSTALDDVIIEFSGTKEAAYIVRGDGFQSRLVEAGAEAKPLLDDLQDKSGKACPVAAELNDDDRVKLAEIEADATAPAAPPPK